MNKIYDCFTFYNEHELLELRLAELYTHVDHFVIVESNQTFTNNAKPWNFDIARYPDYADKIIYIQVEDMPGSTNPWDNEHHQRNAILRGLVTASDDDIVIVSDVDEILRPEAVDHLRDSDQTLFVLRMPLYNFKFNYMRRTPGEYDAWAMAARRSVLETLTPNSLREMRHSFHKAPFQLVNDGFEIVEHAGWHFGYFGNRAHLVDKAQNFSHQEVNRPEFIDQIDVEASIEAGTSWARYNTNEHYAVVDLDSYFPKTIVANPDRYQNYILANATTTALAILPAYTYNT
jgi:Glycosyltransferase family 17